MYLNSCQKEKKKEVLKMLGDLFWTCVAHRQFKFVNFLACNKEWMDIFAIVCWQRKSSISDMCTGAIWILCLSFRGILKISADDASE